MTISKPMLPGSCTNLDDLTLPLFVTPDIEGIKVVVIEGKARTSSLREFPNNYIYDLLSQPELNNCDGEVIVGSLRNHTTVGIKAIDGQPDFTYYVMDLINIDVEYQERIETAAQLDILSTHPRIQLLAPEYVTNQEQLKAALVKLQKQGYNSSILRNPKGLYKEGRSTVKEGYYVKFKLENQI